MTDARFLCKIDGPFICLTAAMMCHSLGSKLTGIFMDKVVFTGSNATGKINPPQCGFRECSDHFGPRDPNSVENRKHSRPVISDLIERRAWLNVRH